MGIGAGESGLAFLSGFFLYAGFEIAARGYTHWTMALLGGCTVAVLFCMERQLTGEPFWVRGLLGALFVTCAEFTVGVFDNLIMGWHVWDYSELRFNLLGQVCLRFSALWFVLCRVAACYCRQLSAACSPMMNSVSSHAISHCSGMRGCPGVALPDRVKRKR